MLSGFGEIHIIDLDTIDLSNLNRQFLFRQEHIKKPKALVAKDVAQKFNPAVKLEAYHANIKDKQFNFEWFSQFHVVFNALDNMDARRHVNKMCLTVDVPLIESGTTGFDGQVQVIKKGNTACYDCHHKATPVSYPVCTIRSTPSQSIHCIVWAKSYLLPELFGQSEDAVAELDSTNDSENAAEIEKLKQEAQALKKIRDAMGSDDFAKQVFDKVFKDDIERLASLEEMWKNKKSPTPLLYDTLESESQGIDNSVCSHDQRMWTLPETFTVFKDSLTRLSKRYAALQAMSLREGLAPPLISFDKDDPDTMDFVAASANLRAHIFSIESQSKFKSKQMAGNIIPAIATTNAMVAGLCVMEGFKVLKGDYARGKFLWLNHGNLTTERLEGPNPECAVCGVAMARIRATEDATLRSLVEDVLQSKLSYSDDFSVMSEMGVIFDPDLEDNLDKKLLEFEIGDASFLLVKDDADDNPRLNLQLAVEVVTSDEEVQPVVLVEKQGEKFEIPRRPKNEPEQEPLPRADDQVVVNGNGTVPTGKRKRELGDDGVDSGTPAKKFFVDRGKGKGKDEVIVVDDDDGTLIIDD